MNDLINAWKNKVVFDKQLKFNEQEFSSYPLHWVSSLQLMEHFKVTSILDVGCGCGSFYKVCKDSLPEVFYEGADYSEDAISLAKKRWEYDGFHVKDVMNLVKEDVESFDLIFLGAVLDVSPKGDDLLDHILSLDAKNILIGRAKLTNETSFYETYTAYDEITTCAYYHNKKNFVDSCEMSGYDIFSIGDNYFLRSRKHNVESS